ncbi:30S ribosome-binding factor RbfA [soil metagenome]
MSVRTEKVAEEIKHQLNIAMSKDLSELHLGLVTISKVIVSPDLKIAKVYLSFLGNEEPADKCIAKIYARKKHIRWLLGQKLTIRYTPDLFFYHDDTIEYSDKMNKLLKEIHDKDALNKIENEKLKSELGLDTEGSEK